MTPPTPDSTSAAAPRRTARRPSLYTTVLSLAIAAVAATWLPFSVLYINALSKHSTPVAALTAPTTPGQPATAHPGSTPAASPTAVTTRVS